MDYEPELKNQENCIHEHKPISKTLLDLWLDNYWAVHLPPGVNTFSENSDVIHKLISQLITQGCDEDVYSRKLHQQKHILEHQELINAVSSKLKPNIFSVLFTKYSKEKILDYLLELKFREYKEDPSFVFTSTPREPNIQKIDLSYKDIQQKQ